MVSVLPKPTSQCSTNPPPGLSRRRITRVVYGTSIREDSIDRAVFGCIKSLTSLLPGMAVTVHEPTIEYEVPLQSIARPKLDNARYFVQTDPQGNTLFTRVVVPKKAPRKYALRATPDRRSIEGVVVHHEETDDSFTVVPDASYIDVKVCTCLTTVEHLCWGLKWVYEFREVFRFPHSRGDDTIHFKHTPQYQIEVWTDSDVNDAVVLDAISCNLPHSYRPANNSDPWKNR